MKKLLFILLMIPLVGSTAGTDKFLDYQFNENVIIRISNVPCKLKDVDHKQYPFQALAARVDGQVLPGCFSHSGDTIVIQWGMGGDKTELPANYFLGEKVVPNT